MKVQYPLLSDTTHEISKCYGAYDTRSGFATRTTLIISPDGLIKYFCKYPSSVGRNAYELLRILEALKYNESTGLATPANWHSGEPGISPSWDLVGKI